MASSLIQNVATITAEQDIFSTGGLNLGGGACVSVFYEYPTQFSVGQVLYDCRTAKIGILDKIAIKKIRVVNSSGTIMYVDTFNRNWNEYDLCLESSAKQLAITYWENQLIAINNLNDFCEPAIESICN